MKKITILILLLICMRQQAQVNLPSIDTNYKRLIFNSESHLINFINHYTANGSEDGLINIVETLENNGFESLLNQTKKETYYENGSLTINNGNIEDDDLIGDDRLAMLLNNNREIIVGNVVYRYEDEGVYFSNLSPTNIKQKITLGKGTLTVNIDNLENEKVHTINSNLKLFKYNYLQGIEYENSNVNHAKTGNQLVNNPYNLKTCNFDDSGFFESILPGSSEVCIQNINTTKRIRTKFSNQNYLLFSSTYAKLKSQKKTKIGWWKKDDFCDFLELGRTVVLKFPLEYPSPKVYSNNLLIKNNSTNRVTDAYGNIINTIFNNTQDVFDSFPFNSSSFNFEIYYYVGTYKPTAQQINKLISDALQGLLTSLGTSHDNLFDPTNDTNVGITIDTPDGIYITEYGEKTRKYGVSKVQKNYDFNISLEFSSNIEDSFNDLINNINVDSFLNAKEPEVVVLDVYGIGSYGGNIYGSRIIKGGLVDDNKNLIDSDGDGVPDSEDICRYQKGFKKFGGCRYSLKDDESLFSNRINSYIDDSSANDAVTNLGACYNLELKSSDFPTKITRIEGGVYNSYNIVAGNKISIKGASNLSLKPSGKTNSLDLKIVNTPCQVNSTYSSKNSGKSKSKSVGTESTKEILTKSKLNVFPNPTKDYLNLVSNHTILKYTILNQLNTKVLEGNINDNFKQINIHNLPPSIYFIKVILSNGNTLTKKFIKH